MRGCSFYQQIIWRLCMLNKFLLALLFGLFLTACGDDVANDSADAELPPLTEEAAEEAAAEEAPAEQSAE